MQRVSSKMVQALKATYSTVKACIRYNQSYSDFIDSNFGVKQGDPSSPMLFMMFINDLNENINNDLEGIFTLNGIKLFLLLYADDQVVFGKSPESVQTILIDIENYCNTWGLKINTSKTKAMIFEKGRHTTYDFYLNNTKLEVVNSFKYLGVYFFKNGNWYRTQKCIADHASYALHCLFSVFNDVELSTCQKCKLFDTLVASVLNYCSEIWEYHEGKDIEIIHTKFCRKVLCVRQSTNLCSLYGELGRVPFYITRKINIIRYWLKLLNMNETSLPKTIYSMLKEDVDEGFHYTGLNWVFHIKTILETHGLGYIWYSQNTGSVPFSFIKQRILDNYYQSWYAEINNSHRLLSYCRFKHDFRQEEYLDFISEKKYRIALSKFRVSAHNLAIEKGRHENIPRNERKCRNCNLNVIENEYHFLLVCPRYSELRRKYFSSSYCHWPNLTKFDNLMTSTSKKVILNIGKFIYHAECLRE